MKKLLFGLLGLLWAIPSWALPAGYTELEYISVSNRGKIVLSSIDLRDNFDVETKISISTSITKYKPILVNPYQNGVWLGGWNDRSIVFRGYSAATYAVAPEPQNMQIVTIKFINNNKRASIFYDGTLKNENQSADAAFTYQAGTPTVLFSDSEYNSSGENFIGNFYYIKINNELYVPAKRNSDGVIGVYNIATNSFFAGNGDSGLVAGPIAEIKVASTKYTETVFNPLNTALQNAISVVDSVVSNTITQAASVATLQSGKQTRPNDITDNNEKCPAGKQCLLVEDASGVPHWYEIVTSILPDGYTELQYIESTGTQYIDTDYIGSATTQVNIDFQLTETAYTILFGTGVADSHTGSNISNYFFANPSESQWGAYVNGSFTYAGTNTDLNRHKVRYNDGNNYYIDDTLFISNKQPSFNKKIYLFASNGDSAVKPTKAKMYSVQIYNNGTPVRKLVPVRRNSDNVIGMYDTVGGRFYTNAGTGSFIAGPAME
ncbi:MAG: hypothetical protein ACLRFM_03055 [Alphaproteobacteria bacterium]